MGSVALMMVVPVVLVTAVASPDESMVATPVSDDFQITDNVKSRVGVFGSE